MRYDPDVIPRPPGNSAAAPLPSPQAAAKAAALAGLAIAPWTFFLWPPLYILALLPDD